MSVKKILFEFRTLLIHVVILFCFHVVIDAQGSVIFDLVLGTVNCIHDRNLQLNVERTQLFFYDFQADYNLTFPIIEGAERITNAYNLDITKKIILFVPGFKSHISKKTEEKVRQTFRNVPDIYLIIVDHSEYTNAAGGKISGYEKSVEYTYYIGEAIGNFLVSLRSKGFPSEKIHAVGHSIGAHMLGYAADSYLSRTGEKIWRITGLDPAGPCFRNSFQDQLRAGLAEHVEIYHCDPGALGTPSVLGDADFFVNKPGGQPLCKLGFINGLKPMAYDKCSHKVCVDYWLHSVHNSRMFPAWACNKYEDFVNGYCAGNLVTKAGYSNPGKPGIFYLSTGGFGIDD